MKNIIPKPKTERDAEVLQNAEAVDKTMYSPSFNYPQTKL